MYHNRHWNLLCCAQCLWDPVSRYPSITIGNVLILFGCIIMVFGFLGCMGAIKENKCLLLTFFILLLLILLIEVVLAIVLFIYEK
ncbi:unnamed protein product, partial [Ranitomeya imitator]